MRFSGRHFPKDVILTAVRWYVRYKLSYRDIEELPGEFATEPVRLLPLEACQMPKKKTRSTALQTQFIERQIYLIRDKRVMLDTDLATLYGVTTFNLNKAVQRNLDRFPEDFMFQLTKGEAEPLKFQIGMSKQSGRGGRRTLPYAFTQEGVAMLSSVLRSERAVEVNIAIMRAFVRLRRLIASHEELSRKLTAMERKYDVQFKVVFDAIRELMKPPPDKPKRSIGFRGEKHSSKG